MTASEFVKPIVHIQIFFARHIYGENAKFWSRWKTWNFANTSWSYEVVKSCAHTQRSSSISLLQLSASLSVGRIRFRMEATMMRSTRFIIFFYFLSTVRRTLLYSASRSTRFSLYTLAIKVNWSTSRKCWCWWFNFAILLIKEQFSFENLLFSSEIFRPSAGI